MTMTAATPETIVEIVDDVFLPLATNFGTAATGPSHPISQCCTRVL
jgi:hypothetical protein